MSYRKNFNTARVQSVFLGKIGNPLRGEQLKTSRSLCQFDDRDQAMLTAAFLKPFRSLDPYHFVHSSSLELHEMQCFAQTIFQQNERFLAYARKIARHLYDKTKHPNIKSGDLCISLLDSVHLNGESYKAICIVKSESLTPFLEIQDNDGDLQLTTHNGIYPEKIDKGCLIVNCEEEKGYVVYTFDKGGADANFWVRDFLGAKVRKNDDFHTKKYSEMCVSFAAEGMHDETPQEKRYQVANDAIQYITQSEEFDEDSFKSTVLQQPEIVEQFEKYKDHFTDEDGEPVPAKFTVNQRLAKQANSKIRSLISLDSGVALKFTPKFTEQEHLLERGFDEEKGMNFIKVYYNEEL